MERDLMASLTHTRLHIETTADALAVMFLVECGVLRPAATDGIHLELGRHLGHGNVLVFLDQNDGSTTLKLDDGRRWQPPLRMSGLHIYRNHNESSKLYRIVLTARKNTIMDDYGMSWHLVAYLDRSPFAAELPTIHSIRRFARCAALMPYGYFIPEFGRLAAEPPPPMKRVNWKTIAFSLPPIQSQQNEWTRGMLPASDIDVQNEARVASMEVFEETPASRLANKSVEALSTRHQILPQSPRIRINKPRTTTQEASCIPASITIAFSEFRKVFLKYLPQWSMTNVASQLVHNSPLFRLRLKRYKNLVAHSGDALHLQEHFHDLLSSIHSSALCANYDTCDNALPNVIFRHVAGTRPRDEAVPTSVAFEYEPGCEHGDYDWRHAILLFQCGGRSPVSTEFQEQQAVTALAPRAPKQCQLAHSAAAQHTAAHSLQEPHGPVVKPSVSRVMIEERLLGLHRCAGEMLNVSPIRRFALGAVVLGMSVYFGYFDRAGAVFGSPIHIEDDAEVFINAVLNACCAGRRCCFTEPPCPDFVYNPVTFPFSKLIDHLNYNLTVNGSISSPSEEDSRPSHLFSARCVSNTIGASGLPPDVMLEMRWSPCPDIGDTDIRGISRLAESNNIGHIARVHASTTACRLSEYERAELGLVPSSDFEFRITLFSPACVPLQSVSDRGHFKQAFITLVKAHYEAYSQIGMLHRDISPRNLMVSRDEPNRGLLSGFYSATAPMTVGPPMARAQAFLAVELMGNDTEPAVFRYRHDLESFLYVLAWIALRPQDEPAPHPLCGWWRHNCEMSRNLKLQFLKGGFPHEDVAASVVPLHWVMAITELFRQGYEALEGSSSRPGMTDFDEETLGGHITYEKFLDVISA